MRSETALCVVMKPMDGASRRRLGVKKDGHYRVRLYGEWVPVPDATVVTEPNRFGPAVVWPYLDTDGTTQVRCFLPGAGG